MKNQGLFSSKDKSIKIKMSSAARESTSVPSLLLPLIMKPLLKGVSSLTLSLPKSRRQNFRLQIFKKY